MPKPASVEDEEPTQAKPAEEPIKPLVEIERLNDPDYQMQLRSQLQQQSQRRPMLTRQGKDASQTPAKPIESEPKPINYAEQDYQMQLMLLEQQNKKRLMLARQEMEAIQKTPVQPAEAAVKPGNHALSDYQMQLMFLEQHQKKARNIQSVLHDNACEESKETRSPEVASMQKSFEGLNVDRVAMSSALPPLAAQATVPSVFKVYCNNCSVPIDDVHYHCTTCDDGDFDLCPACRDAGCTCDGEHWLIKRTVHGGRYIHSTTEKLAPKQLSEYRALPERPFSDSKTTLVAPPVEEEKENIPTRTCNSCILEFNEENFVTCTDCDDFDLCIRCHLSLKHGHNPKHAFAYVTDDLNHGTLAKALLAPGRNTSHAAICDGCDKYIFGVRHKCLDCPDWDLCNSCIVSASSIHPRHRFVPLYDCLKGDVREVHAKARHSGIYCDGPRCKHDDSVSDIIGDRYKCAVCHDTDFCASCEASPLNNHNKTHPLIKFKTPVRNVTVSTFGEDPRGRPLAPMGDHPRDTPTISKATETTPAQSTNAATQVQTVAEVEPTEVKTEEPAKIEEPAKVQEAAKELPAPIEEELVATFVRDAVTDGTTMSANSVFEQTWYLRNGGKTSWPAGCSVKFVGGDNMCALDPEHPASVHELVSAAESTTCYTEVAPGQEYGFTVLMRTPNRAGKFISYWRLTAPTGEKFGHRLWCDINVNEPTPVVKEEFVEDAARDVEAETVKTENATTEAEKSGAMATVQVEADKALAKSDTMVVDHEATKAILSENKATSEEAIIKDLYTPVFPTLDKESPISSIHEEAQQAPAEAEASEETFNDDFDEFNPHFEDDEAEDGFMTDEEYDILDASDEEYLAEQESASKK